MFYHKDLTEPVIRAVVDEEVYITDPLIEHQNDIVKAIRSNIWLDVFTRDIRDYIYTLDMQRRYFKTRNRNRNVYYGVRELSNQTVNEGRYEHLKHVAITFIFENNTTPNAPPISKIQLTDVNTQEIYTDLLTLYEVNLNRITQDQPASQDQNNTQNQPIPQDLIILKDFLTIKTHEDLCNFVNTHDTPFSQLLIIRYMDAITDDALLIEIEGSEKFMFKLTDERLKAERDEGIIEGIAKGVESLINATVRMILELGITVTQAMKITALPENEQHRVIEKLDKENIPYAL